MATTRNIVVVGASAAGVPTTHYILRHILPAIRSVDHAVYHVYTIAPSSSMFFRIGAPRVAASIKRLAAEQIVFNLNESFARYPAREFTFIEALATGLDTASRTITYRPNKTSIEEILEYHALVIATGSQTFHPAFSLNTSLRSTLDSIQDTNERVESARRIVIVGGGPTGVEFAGEVAEHRNGKPGWFSSVRKNLDITLLTSGTRLLPALRPSIGKAAETKLNYLGVEVVYGARVVGTSLEGGITRINLQNGQQLEADLYVPAYGVQPNTSWLPHELLDGKKYLKTNDQTLRVDAAGPRVYALGDVASYSTNNIQSITDGKDVLLVNLKQDLLAFDPERTIPASRDADKLYVHDARENQIVPIGSTGGVGAILGYRLPSFLVWLIKGRDYMVQISAVPMARGDSVAREIR